MVLTPFPEDIYTPLPGLTLAKYNNLKNIWQGFFARFPIPLVSEVLPGIEAGRPPQGSAFGLDKAGAMIELFHILMAG
jgi:hypothetical protein